MRIVVGDRHSVLTRHSQSMRVTSDTSAAHPPIDISSTSTHRHPTTHRHHQYIHIPHRHRQLHHHHHQHNTPTVAISICTALQLIRSFPSRINENNAPHPFIYQIYRMYPRHGSSDARVTTGCGEDAHIAWPLHSPFLCMSSRIVRCKPFF